MDTTDRKILSALQADGRIAVADLSQRVGISASPCHRRLRNLEQTGVVTGYRPVIDAPAVGLNFSAIVFATLKEGSRDNVAAFEAALFPIREIIQAERLFGDPDYMLQVVTRDLGAFQRLYDEKLLALPSVLRLSSTLVMKQIFRDRPLPL